MFPAPEMADEAVRTLVDLVRIPSQTGLEEKARLFLADRLAGTGLAVGLWKSTVESVGTRFHRPGPPAGPGPAGRLPLGPGPGRLPLGRALRLALAPADEMREDTHRACRPRGHTQGAFYRISGDHRRTGRFYRSMVWRYGSIKG